jgi:hypothetical protein
VHFIFAKKMRINNVKTALSNLREQLINHSLYGKIESTEDLSVFLKLHVFAVWDFMSLLKALQQQLTCTSTPWIPIGNPETRFLINEIVLAEETDLNLKGERKSHFEMYLDAMKECNTNTTLIDNFLSDLNTNKNIDITIENSNLDEALKAFLRFTFKTIKTGKPHEIAAAFTFGREELIPNMFTEILTKLQHNFPNSNLSQLIYYFQRHIELDEDEHGPMAMKMIEALCNDDDLKWEEVLTVSKIALKVRINLWNAIEKQLQLKRIID